MPIVNSKKANSNYAEPNLFWYVKFLNAALVSTHPLMNTLHVYLALFLKHVDDKSFARFQSNFAVANRQFENDKIFLARSLPHSRQ